MEISKTTWWMIGGASAAAVAIGVYFISTKKQLKGKGNDGFSAMNVGKGVQIVPNKVSKTRQVPNWNNPFDMNYLNDVRIWLAPKSILFMDSNLANQYAQALKKAKGRFNDDEAMVKAIFSRKLKDKTQVSSLSRAFWMRYKKDMWHYLSSFLSKNEMQTLVNQHVKQLPNYTII